jgi:hypothetical protein
MFNWHNEQAWADENPKLDFFRATSQTLSSNALVSIIGDVL